MTWPRPVPLIGDQSSAAQRASAPDAWRLSTPAREGLYEAIRSRRDVRRYRPDPVPEEVLDRVLTAAHAAPSVGHSQPWRFVIVDDPAMRDRAALLADAQRLAQAAQLDADSARHLLDLQLEGIREAPLGVVICCDRRVPAAGVLGRATFPDADVWSCACAIENLWLAARAEGLGLGWVTLFEPDDLASLLGLPEGVVTLGWLCLGWPDERPPEPGLERAGWSRRAPLESVVIRNRWPAGGPVPEAPRSRLAAPDQSPGYSSPLPGSGHSTEPAGHRSLPAADQDTQQAGHRSPLLGLDRSTQQAGRRSSVPGLDESTQLARRRPPSPGLDQSTQPETAGVEVGRGGNARSAAPDQSTEPAAARPRLAAPDQRAVVAARDEADTLLSTPSSLGVLDRAVDRAVALGHSGLATGTLVLAAGRHPATELGISAFSPTVTGDVLAAARAGQAFAAVAARSAGLELSVVDAGAATGNLRDQDPLTDDQVRRLLADGESLGARLAAHGLVALGEVGVGNTTVAAALAASLLGLPAGQVVGRGADADTATIDRKTEVVGAALARWAHEKDEQTLPVRRLAVLGGPEFSLLTGVVLGAARAGAVVVLDGLATTVAAQIAVVAEPGVAAHLVAGQRSRERAHPLLLQRLGLEPLLDLRLRAGEGVGAALASQLLFTGLRLRAQAARTAAVR